MMQMNVKRISATFPWSKLMQRSTAGDDWLSFSLLLIQRPDPHGVRIDVEAARAPAGDFGGSNLRQDQRLAETDRQLASHPDGNGLLHAALVTPIRAHA